MVSFEPPSLYSATECIKRANIPKLHLLKGGAQNAVLANIYGRFDEIVVDNGLELVGNAFEDAAADCGISIRWAPVRSPTYKAVIERFFRTIDDRLLHKLPGSTLNPQALRDLEINPEAKAVLTLSELEALIWEVINLYGRRHRTRFSPLRGRGGGSASTKRRHLEYRRSFDRR